MSSDTHCERPVFSVMVVCYKMNADSSWQDPEPQSCLLLVPIVSPELPHQGVPGGDQMWIFWAEGEPDLLFLPHLSLLLDFSV